MKIKLIRLLSLILLLTACGSLIFAEGDHRNRTLNKTLGSPSFTRLNINSISTYFYNNGSSDLNNNNTAGFYFPKGTGRTCMFQAGFLWGGNVNGQFRTGGSAYRQGTLPGRILPNGTAANPNDPDVRIYRVRRDYATGSLQDELNDGDGPTIDAIRAQYATDWNEWPASQGAPFEDVNGDGIYDPTVDIPGVPGADQTIWFVCNDLDPNTSQYFYGALPMGIEEQVTVWGYKATGALGNMLFRKYTIINKNTTQQPFTNMYVCMWADPDDGDANDDYCGCDTTLSLSFIYNSKSTDAVYTPLPPPAAGFDFFQGPKIAGAPTDTAIYKGRKWAGFKNLPMTVFFYFINPDPVYSDPNQGNYNTGTLEWLNLFQGKISSTGVPFTDPHTGKQTMFTLAGDPLTQTGWVDGQLNPPGDRRMGMASGTFNMAYGDTQEIVVAELAAGAINGVDNLQAVKLLKDEDVAAQIAYNRFFQLPRAPQQPTVTASPFDQKIILNWGSDVTTVNKTESYNSFGYVFEGYNVYQLPSASATVDAGVRIATYDVVDLVKKVIDLVFDPTAGVAIQKVTAFGNDTGIKRELTVTTDAFTNLPLHNGSKYYFAVTSYAYNPAPPFGSLVLENSIATITVVPQTPNPGTRYTSRDGDQVVATRTAGSSDGKVIATVVDPSKVTGASYKVTFKTDPANPATGVLWTLTKGSTVMLDNQSNLSGDDTYLITDGLQVKVTGPPAGVKTDDMYSTSDTTKWGWSIGGTTRRFTPAGADPNYGFLEAFGPGGFGYQYGALGYNSPATFFNGTPMTVKPAEVKKVKLLLAHVDFAGNWGPPIDKTDKNVSYGYRYMRHASTDPTTTDPKFAPFILNPVGGTYPFQEFAQNVPLTAWNIEDPKNPKQLAVGFLENNVAGGLVDGVYWPGAGSVTAADGFISDNTGTGGPREWLFIMDEAYSTTANSTYTGLIGDPGPRVMYLACWNRRNGYLNWSKPTGADQFLIYPNHAIGTADVFQFTAPSVTVDQNLAKQDVNQINVFPNPYYGVNSQEINKYQKFVTFSHLPQRATIRIFNLAGQSVRTLSKDTPDQFFRWDLNNDSGLPVASGLYLVYVDMPDLGTTKILKVAIIQEQQILDRF